MQVNTHGICLQKCWLAVLNRISVVNENMLWSQAIVDDDKSPKTKASNRRVVQSWKMPSCSSESSNVAACCLQRHNGQDNQSKKCIGKNGNTCKNHPCKGHVFKVSKQPAWWNYQVHAPQCLHPTIGLSNYGWRLPCPARFSNGTMVFLCVRNRVNICHMQMHETFAIWYCTLRNAMYIMPPDFDIKPQQLQHKVEWNEGAQHETCLQIPWDNRQQACVRWSMTMPSTVIQTKDWSCHVWITFVACPQRDAFCSVTQKAFLSTCQARTSGSTTQFFFRAPTRQRGFDHTDGMVSLVQARLEKVVRSFQYMISKAARYSCFQETPEH